MRHCWLLLCLSLCWVSSISAHDRPNILFFFVDDWGRYAGVYADPETPSLNDVVQTPNIDRIAKEGVLFNNAFVPVASCGPCRASLATGRYFWNCGSGAFLNGKASDWKGHENPFKTLPKFPDLLREEGYFAQKSVKTIAFTPSPWKRNRKELPAYQRYGLYVSEAQTEKERELRIAETLAHPRLEMKSVIEACPQDQPFFFIYGTINVHRPYVADSGKKLWNIDPDRLKGLIPKFLPDVDDVRRDFSDYLGEVQASDAMLGVMLDELEKAGELDNTVVILSGDHGIPGVPRGKTNCYDLAIRAPLMVRWPKKIAAGRVVEDFVSIMDIGPTLLELAGASVPESMQGRSFEPQLVSPENGWIDPERKEVIVGRELHVHDARAGNLPYPMRAIRTPEYLYIRNFKTDRWPMGDPRRLSDGNAPTYEELHKQTQTTLSDLDASLTKAWMVTHRFSSEAQELFDLTLGKRPAEELYDLKNDPQQMNNLAELPAYQTVKEKFAERLLNVQTTTDDPRLKDLFDQAPYVATPTN